MTYTPGLDRVPANDLRFLPSIGGREFKEWRASGLRIDEWIAREHPESNLARGAVRPELAPPPEEVAAPARMFGLYEPTDSDVWPAGRE